MTNEINQNSSLTIDHILDIPGADISLFHYDKQKRKFEINKSDFPDTSLDGQKDYLIPGNVFQSAAGVLNYTVALTPLYKSADKYTPSNAYFCDSFHKDVLVIYSSKTNTKAYFNLSKPPKNPDYYRYNFAAIYPFDPQIFRALQRHFVIVHNI